MIQAKFDHKKYLRFLQVVNKKAHAESVKNVLNFQAKESEKLIKKTVKRKFVTRTQFTINSIKQDRKALGSNVNKMFSRVVTVSPYLWKADEGHKENRKSIPTNFSRGNSFQKVVRRMYRQDRLGDFGSDYRSFKFKSFFIGKPRGGNREYGIWMRHNMNKRLTKIKNVSRSDIRIKPTKFFTDSVGEYIKKNKIDKIFSYDAQERLKYTAERFY